MELGAYTCSICNAERPTILRAAYGRFGAVGNETVPPTRLWRIRCPERDQEIITVVMEMKTYAEDYLQLKTKALEGCLDSSTWSDRFMKQSILVGLVSASNITRSEFDLRYVCVGESESSVLYVFR